MSKVSVLLEDEHGEGSEIVEIDIESEHPLLKRAGIFQDDPQLGFSFTRIKAGATATP